MLLWEIERYYNESALQHCSSDNDILMLAILLLCKGVEPCKWIVMW